MKEKIVLRQMRIHDLDGALSLWNKTSGVVVREYDDSPEGITRFLSHNPDTSLVLDLDGEIVGTLLCGNDGRRGFLYHFVVREDLRGCGLGKRLLQTAYSRLREYGIAKGGVVVLTDNTSGVQFWEYNGWLRRDDLHYFDFFLSSGIE